MSDLSDTPPPEVEAELAKYLDDYEESLRKGLDAYFKVEQEKAWKQKWTADTFDEASVSRDRGRFSSGSGDDAAESEKPKGDSKPKVLAGRKASEGAMAKAQAGVDAISPAHAQFLKHVPVTVVRSPRDIPRKENDTDVVGLYLRKEKAIMVAEVAPPQNLFGIAGGVGREMDVRGNTIHEFGHAYDYHFDNKPSQSLLLRRGNDQSALRKGHDRMSKEERDNAGYQLSSIEAFAELYKAVYNPAGQSTYFSGMSRKRVSEVFPEALAKVKSFHNATDRKTIDKLAIADL